MPMAFKISKVVICHEGFSPIKSHEPKAHGFAKLRNILKPLHIHYHSAYSHQIWWDGFHPLFK